MAAAKKDIAKTLERAHAKLTAATSDTSEAALDALLVAWRARRIARIAELIDRVSEDVTHRRGGPVAGKTVKDRTTTWLKLAKKLAAADVGRLITTPWPGTWRDAMPVITALVKFPHDPRIAMALARIVAETPYDTWTSSAFYAPLLAYLGEQNDLRTLPVLEAQIGRERSHYWARRTGRLETALVAKLREVAKDEPRQATTLSNDEETALAKLEALFAGAKADETSAATNEAQFLKAIYEAPDDDAPREVFADWLSERNDPRGEFISIQLAHHAGRVTDASLKREASLLKKHEKEWVGVLDSHIAESGRVFERGFLASACLLLHGTELPPALSDPSWSTLHSLELSHEVANGAEIAALPSMKWLRVVRRLDEAELAKMIQGAPRPRILEVDFIVWRDDEAATGVADNGTDPNRLLIVDSCLKTFPNAKHLAIAASDINKADWILASPLAKRAERITLYNADYPLDALAAAVTKHRLPAKELVLAYGQGHEYPLRAARWLFSAERDDSNRFTKLHGEAEGLSTIPSSYPLRELLEGLKPTELTELTIDRARVCKYDESDIRALEEHLATFTNLTRVEVPWDRLDSPNGAKLTSAPGEAKEAQRFLSIRLEGKAGSQKDVAKIWALVHEEPLALTLDSYAVNDGKHMLLPTAGEDAIEHTNEVLTKARTHSIRLYRKGASERSAVDLRPFKPRKWRSSGSDSLSIFCAWRDDPSFVDQYLAWLVRLLDSIKVDEAISPFAPAPPPQSPSADDDPELEDADVPMLEPLRREPHFGWIGVLGEGHAKRLPFTTLEKLAGSKGLESLRVVRSQRNAILVASARPDLMPNKDWQDAFQIGLSNVMWGEYKRLWKIDPRDLVIDTLAPRLKKHGFTRAALSPLDDALGKMLFVSRGEATGARGINIALTSPMDGMCLETNLRHAVSDKDADVSMASAYQDSMRTLWVRWAKVYDPSVKNEKEARKIVADFASKIDTEIMPWFEHPDADNAPSKKKKKRRR